MIQPPTQDIEPKAPPHDISSPEDEEVSNDAIQLIVIATFNGLCRTMTALAEQGLLSDADIEGIHDAMTTPLDDPTMRDDEFVADTRILLEKILSDAMKLARCGLVRDG